MAQYLCPCSEFTNQMDFRSKRLSVYSEGCTIENNTLLSVSNDLCLIKWLGRPWRPEAWRMADRFKFVLCQ